MANVITLKSFPFDSMEVLNSESGKMEADRLYEAEIFRKYFAKFLSNGVYFGNYKSYGENSMKVTDDGGLNIRVSKGAGIIEGADYENEEEKIFTLERPTSGNRVDRVVVKLDKTLAVRETQLYIKQGNSTTPASLQRDDNIYEICLAEVTVKSTTNINKEDIKDTRMDKELCGIVNSLISIDGKELYQNFQNYIDGIIENLVRKDQDIIIEGNIVAKSIKQTNGKTFSDNNFTNEYKSKLDGIANNANNYTHPSTHSATMIEETTSRRFVTDTEKTTWNSKQKAISKGTGNPSGGSNGDIYIQYFN
jgi:hypothetical protein